ncbi:MAG: hypothetical protein RR193_06990, partial [Christensenellaceae bacterium]
DIFKGWCRMYGSMCLMMLMNVVFLKLLLSAMSTVPSGTGIFPWLIFKEKPIAEHLSVMPSDSVFEMESGGILIETVQNYRSGYNRQ